ncbi:MAG: ADP-ribosylation factor-like protein [Defluviitaleaceae bacterium]|nr:ADP-ribosylation factor-like protein [Defluviitaleaceae bacterium]
MGCGYWADWYEELFRDKFVLTPERLEEMEIRLDAPGAIMSEGAAAVAAHMLSLKEQGMRETREARIILIGSKGAGKTSLSMKLHDVTCHLPELQASTPGVDTSILDLIEGETTHLWDFGGHVIAQAAHKFFMSGECVYVFVVDGRREQQMDLDELRKWLSAVKAYSQEKAKVFVVVNISDEHYQDMPKNKLEKEFPKLIEDYFNFNFKTDKKTDQDELFRLKNALKDYINANLVRKLPAQYFDFKERLEQEFKEKEKEILRDSDIKQLAEQSKLEDDSQGALGYLNTLGVSLQYDNIPDIILNPSWISNGVYTIINHMQNNGLIRIHRDEIPKLFKGEDAKRYDADNCDILYELMVQYELAFVAKDKPNTLIVPATLPNDEPNDLPSPENGEEVAGRRYSFEISLADNVFPKYIQRNHEHIARDASNDYIMWASGMVIEKDKVLAVITKESRDMEIKTWGESSSELLNELHHMFIKLLDEHKQQLEDDKIELNSGYYPTDVIKRLHRDGTDKFDGMSVQEIGVKYGLDFSLIRADNIEVNAGVNLKNNVQIGNPLGKKSKKGKVK